MLQIPDERLPDKALGSFMQNSPCKMNNFLPILSFIDGTLQLPETNLAFAISATSLEAEQTHTFMKEIIKSIIDEYGTERLEYSVIVYGDSASTEVPFGEIFESSAELIKAVGSIPRVSGVPSLDKALEAAKQQFESPLIRPNAAKVMFASH